MHAWHVATVQPMMELVAAQHLLRQGFVPFNPQYEVTRITRGRETTTKHPYFSGYILIQFDRSEQRWRSINGTRGVKRLMLSDFETPARVPDHVVGAILKMCDERGMVEAAKVDTTLARLVPIGSTVRVADGPFEGQVGRVTWSKGERVKMLMSILGTQREVRVDHAMVELV